MKGKQTRMPWRRFRKYLGLYLLLSAVYFFFAFNWYHEVPYKQVVVWAAAIVFGLLTVAYFVGDCCVLRWIAEAYGQQMAEERMRNKGICPIHGASGVELRERSIYFDNPSFGNGEAHYCLACREFLDRGAGQLSWHHFDGAMHG